MIDTSTGIARQTCRDTKPQRQTDKDSETNAQRDRKSERDDSNLDGTLDPRPSSDEVNLHRP